MAFCLAELRAAFPAAEVFTFHSHKSHGACLSFGVTPTLAIQDKSRVRELMGAGLGGDLRKQAEGVGVGAPGGKVRGCWGALPSGPAAASTPRALFTAGRAPGAQPAPLRPSRSPAGRPCPHRAGCDPRARACDRAGKGQGCARRCAWRWRRVASPCAGQFRSPPKPQALLLLSHLLALAPGAPFLLPQPSLDSLLPSALPRLEPASLRP